MKRPPELFDLFMTYSFKNLDQKVAAGNVIVNYTSRKKCTKKRKSAESTTKLKAKKDESQDERVKKFKGAEGKEPVVGKQVPSTITSFFSTKPLTSAESKDEPVKKAKKDESQDERVKKFKGAEGKEPVSDNEDPLSEDSSF
jgi:hypothetical protein